MAFGFVAGSMLTCGAWWRPDGLSKAAREERLKCDECAKCVLGPYKDNLQVLVLGGVMC